MILRTPIYHIIIDMNIDTSYINVHTHTSKRRFLLLLNASYFTASVYGFIDPSLKFSFFHVYIYHIYIVSYVIYYIPLTVLQNIFLYIENISIRIKLYGLGVASYPILSGACHSGSNENSPKSGFRHTMRPLLEYLPSCFISTERWRGWSVRQ